MRTFFPVHYFSNAGEETLYYDKREIEGLEVGMEVSYKDSDDVEGKAKVCSLEDVEESKRVKIVLKKMDY